ncbi:MAG: glycosyltransferase [Tannerellaceae bacterium]|jgi:glycosyltransferase involved in cell wall biosynthesis|nr:glycosyltransferase [Tannerellaceae bacterium]
MKIYVFGTRGFPGVQGGVEKHCECLYPELSEAYEIVVFRRKAYLPKQRQASFKGIRFIDLPSTRIKGFESFWHSLLCTLVCLIKRPQLVHIHNTGPGMFIPLLKLFGLKVLLTYHSVNHEHEKWGCLARRILKLSERIATKGADMIVFVNPTRMAGFSEEIRRKAVYIPNGIHPQARTEDTDYLSALGLQAGQYILTVGRFTQEKGWAYLVEAYLQSGVSIPLVLAGGIDHATHYVKQILQKTAGHPNILMPGYVEGERLRQLYSHARLFVLPSYSEGFPLVLLEAMNYRLPILASDIEANKLLPLHWSHYFKAGDRDDLARHLSDELNKPAHLPVYDLSSYTWEDIAQKVNRLFNIFA